jgi:hypothetical protein
MRMTSFETEISDTTSCRGSHLGSQLRRGMENSSGIKSHGKWPLASAASDVLVSVPRSEMGLFSCSIQEGVEKREITLTIQNSGPQKGVLANVRRRS